MSGDSSMTELNGFLAKHEPVAKPRLYDVGSLMGEWRITAFLGSGGNAEVYRVVRESDGQIAAAKVLLREDGASKQRFRQEAALLSAQMGPSFARFYASGETNERPFIVSELLEPVDLPETEKEITTYLLAVCRAVGVLHQAGLIHRDIKPSNIMRRANGELVLIDLGLVKNEVKSSEPERDVSIVSGKVITVGTPRFAAPEQLMGGRVTAAADVHAIGRLADVAFGPNPPRSWLPIIRRATSSIADHRYPTVEDLAHAIRHRNNKRYAILAASVLGLLALLIGVVSSLWDTRVRPQLAWSALCENVTTNLVVKELAWERFVTNKIGNSTMALPERAYRQVQKPTAATLVRLRGQTNDFDRPLVLDASREYFVEGPGILAAEIQAKGGTVRVHLKNCFLFNRSSVPIDKAGVRYVFEGGAYLNFTSLDEPPRSMINACIEEFDGAFDVIRFKDPMSRRELEREREARRQETLKHETKTFFKNFHFPRHIFAPRGKYVVDDMEDSIYKKYGISQNRVPTDAEVELVAYCFDISIAEAKQILDTRRTMAKLRTRSQGVHEGDC